MLDRGFVSKTKIRWFDSINSCMTTKQNGYAAVCKAAISLVRFQQWSYGNEWHLTGLRDCE